MSVRAFFSWLATTRGCSVRDLASQVGRDASTLVRESGQVRPGTAERWSEALHLSAAERDRLRALVRARRPSPIRAWAEAQRRGWSVADLAMACGLSEYVAGCWIRGVRRSSGGPYVPAGAWDARIASVLGADVLTDEWQDECKDAAAYWRETRGRVTVQEWQKSCLGPEWPTGGV